MVIFLSTNDGCGGHLQIFGAIRTFPCGRYVMSPGSRNTGSGAVVWGFTQRAKEMESLWHEDKAKLCRSYAASLPHSKTCYYNRHSRDNKNEAPCSISFSAHLMHSSTWVCL
jgi:hypothetical protein